jgi:hypothetical protein
VTFDYCRPATHVALDGVQHGCGPDRDFRQLEPFPQTQPQLNRQQRARGAAVQPQEASHLLSRHSVLAQRAETGET